MTKKKNTLEKKMAKDKSFLNSFDFGNYIPPKYQVLAGFILIFAVIVIYLAPAYFGGKIFQSGDIVSQFSFTNFNAKGDNYLWNPYIFCGLPIFGNAEWFDIIGKMIGLVRQSYSSLLANSYAGYSIYFFLITIGSFLLMRYKKANIGVSIFTALTTVFSMGIITLLFEGHVNKLSTLSVLPLIIYFALKLKDKFNLLDAAILAITIKFMFSQWHVQIIFYIYAVLVVFIIFYFINSIKNNNVEVRKNLLKFTLLLIIITSTGAAMHYYRLGQMYEYTPYSTRGTKSVTDISASTIEKVDANFYQYSTNWSFSPGEVLTFFVPSYYGFGNSVYNGPLTNNKDMEVNTYFGQMPFTNAALYMGIIILLLAMYSIFIRWKDPFVKLLTIIIGLSLFLSFGRNLPFLYDLFYNYMPFFGKFRVPVMVLTVVQIFVPVLAGLGLMEIINLRESNSDKLNKLFRNSLFVIIGLFVISIVLSGSISEWFISRIQASPNGSKLQHLFPYMGNMFLSDLRTVLILLSLAFGGILAYLNRKISYHILLTVIIILSVYDLVRIDNRALHYRNDGDLSNKFVEPDYLKAIKNTNDNSVWRLLNLKQDGSLGALNQNSNFHVYFLEEDFYGYSSLKPRSYQDIVDIVGLVNKTLWRMLNVKYIITEQMASFPGLVPIYNQGKTVVFKNELVLPRAYFVDSLSYAPALQILNKIKNDEFDPKQLAFTSDKNLKLTINKTDSSAFVKITDYQELKITLDVNASGNNLLFLGTTFYPLGWNAYIDGNETEILKINHGFNGLVIPSGLHKVEFIYAPPTYEYGKILTLILNLIYLLAFIPLIVIKIKSKN